MSSKDDVKQIFGEKCEKQCDYDADWLVSFEYFDDIWIKESSNNKGDKRTYHLDPRYLGKLRVIEIRPKKQISFANVSFGPAFKNLIITSTPDGRSGTSSTTVNDAFQDADGLTYEIYSRTNNDDLRAKNATSHNKGDLVLIHYEIPNDRKNDLFVLDN